jgi:hypothetical protein
MAKAKKPKKKKGKYGITIKSKLSPDELLKQLTTLPPKNKQSKKKN